MKKKGFNNKVMSFGKNKKIFWKNNKLFMNVTLFFMIFPIVVGLIYAIPCPQIINITSGDLLGYYGTVFGIMGSFVTYRCEIHKRAKERRKELKPIFYVELKLKKDSSDIFIVKIRNCSDGQKSFLYLYDEFVHNVIEKEIITYVTFNKSVEEIKKIEKKHRELKHNYYNITMDPEIVDNDGYPKYVQILCDDAEKNTWNCCFNKINDCNKIYYYPCDFEIV